MSLLAEEVVEEWLSRHGDFTIRGINVGGGEIDILAIRPQMIPGGVTMVGITSREISMGPNSASGSTPRDSSNSEGCSIT